VTGGGETRRVLSVTQLNALSRELLEGAFPSVWVEGEISNFQAAGSGHWYFTLKDSGAQLRCAMFRGRNIRARLRPANGVSVQVRGGVSLYAPRGDYQLIVDEIEAGGLGALQRAFEELKRRLAAEGLFEAARKRALPRFPAHVAVVTSAQGAALRDILTVLGRRYPSLPVSVLPVAVQGADAARQIAAAITAVNAHGPQLEPPVDVIIVGRGGGSLEDLWAFNEEAVVRAIHASAIPVVSAVGHETDVTLADFAADLRAPTPSAAAELVSPDRAELLARLATRAERLRQLHARRLGAARERLDWLARRLSHPGARLREQSQRLDELELRLRGGMRLRLRLAGVRLATLRSTLAARTPAALLGEHRRVLAQLARRLDTAVRQALNAREERLAAGARLLESVSPLATLGRGYAIVHDAGGVVVRDAADVAPGARVRARLARGALECTVDACLPEP
jgi:exodeoxyribonuclease VII large subunit